uniref:small monomeric GTPase n=1 Tax=Dromaius novaehollandiae TaxID=8790 RepID=A0A8C4JZ13_DRONO
RAVAAGPRGLPRSADGVRYRLPLRAEGVLGPELRLHVQDPDHRQQQRGQDLLPLPVRRRLLHARLRQHRRHRLQGQNHLPQRQAHQAADLGHRRAGAVPHHHHRLLPRGHGLHPHVRHHQRGVLQRRAGLVSAALTSPNEPPTSAAPRRFSFIAFFASPRSTQIKTYSWDNAQVLLVGNKCDMEDERVVSSEKGRQLAEHLGFEFFEASAKDNINVKQTFERLVDIICEKMSESLDTADPAVTGAKQGPQLTDQQAPPHQDCAC